MSGDSVFRTRSLGVAAEGLPDQYADGKAAKVGGPHCVRECEHTGRIWVALYAAPSEHGMPLTPASPDSPLRAARQQGQARLPHGPRPRAARQRSCAWP